MFWTIIIAMIMLCLGWIMISPIRLLLDSRHQNYGIYWYGMGSVRFIMKSGWPFLHAHILFWRKDWKLFSSVPGKKKKESKKQSKNKRWWTPSKAKAFLKTFEIKKYRLILDTDDVILNSYLYPLFRLLSRPNRHMKIIYQGDSEIYLLVENRLYKMIRTLLFK